MMTYLTIETVAQALHAELDVTLPGETGLAHYAAHAGALVLRSLTDQPYRVVVGRLRVTVDGTEVVYDGRDRDADRLVGGYHVWLERDDGQIVDFSAREWGPCEPAVLVTCTAAPPEWVEYTACDRMTAFARRSVVETPFMATCEAIATRTLARLA